MNCKFLWLYNLFPSNQEVFSPATDTSPSHSIAFTGSRFLLAHSYNIKQFYLKEPFAIPTDYWAVEQQSYSALWEESDVEVQHVMLKVKQ